VQLDLLGEGVLALLLVLVLGVQGETEHVNLR
jgi:hypothetical protein